MAAHGLPLLLQDTPIEGEWTEGAAWLHALGDVGPWFLLAAALFFIARAVANRHRYRALDLLGQAEQERVHQAIREVEARTVGEILPVVLERSDPHPATAWRAACATLLVGSTLLVRILPWGDPLWLMACQFALAAAGFALARKLPHLARMFVFETRASSVAEEQALQEFYREGLHKTEAATGVLLFVSLFERRVIVLADEGIAARVPSDTWSKVDDAILDGVAGGNLADGLVNGLHRCGDVLAEHFPWTDGDRNEVPDRLVVRRE